MGKFVLPVWIFVLKASSTSAFSRGVRKVTRIQPTVVTSTRQYATSETYGHIHGNAPIMVGDSIANGGATFGSTTTNATATGTFNAGAIGATASIHGIGPVGGFGH